MNLLLIAGILAGGLLIAGLVMGNIVTADASQEDSNELECSTCGNSCTAQNNCGLATCGAVNGKGSCGCRR